MPEQNNPGTSIMQKNSRSSAVLRSKSHHHKESKMHHTEYKTHLRDGSKLRELPQQVPHSVPKSPSELHSNKFSPFGNDVTVNKYRQDTKYHHCTLPGEPTDVLTRYIEAGVWKFMPGYIKDSVLKHSEHVVKMLMMVSYGPPVFKQMHETVCPMIFIIIGFVFHLIMLIHGAEIWLKFFSKDYKQSAVYGATEAYMRYRALPMSLRERIYLYLDFRYQGHFYKESVIRNATSVALRREILLTMTQKSIEKVELFENCPVIILNKIKASLVSNIYLPGDVIIKSGTTGHCMFFILAGTVVVTTTDNKELCYLRDGSHFGEIALVVNIKRVANVIAVTACELFKLDRNHFWEVMKNHPQAYNNIKTMATERVANTSQSIADISIRDSIFSTATNRSGDKPEIAIAY
ncbi:hypothetical protein HUJ04_007576 [Dendroctonus ponderosae]|nr:hypothetical protein HUJ04_007576 [Dendroctonus ponderosae]